jgi:hypothetical protein
MIAWLRKHMAEARPRQNPPERRCYTCRHFVSYGEHGDCHRHAPVMGHADRVNSGRWPTVSWLAVCGDYEQNQTGDSK